MIYRWHWHFVAAISESTAISWISKNEQDTFENEKKRQKMEYENHKDEEEYRDYVDQRTGEHKRGRDYTDDDRVSILDPTKEIKNDEKLSKGDENLSQNTEDISYSFSVSFWWGKRILKVDK
jgi:hypothetical protein